MAVERDERDAATLEAGYDRTHRAYELGGIIGAVIMASWLLVRIVHCTPLSLGWMTLAAFIGVLAADFTSGFVHWMFDTWGSVDTPIVGRIAIRTFRHHHVDQKAITRHDFVETNGHNFALSLLPGTVGVLWVRPETATSFDVFLGVALLGLAIVNTWTSQIHKWAHQDQCPRIVLMLQRARIILHPEHHSLHHQAPYRRNYCITLGWLNAPLRAIRFFETLERIITAVTGAIPREDDLGAELAAEVAAEVAAELDDEHKPKQDSQPIGA
jgi:ubiquitin-conjugating enzyme E2 variant